MKVREWKQKNNGRLVCEVPGCGFDFNEVYGPLGEGFAEVHHLEPLSSRAAPEATKVSELAVVCANCHRMIHLGGECRSLEGLINRPSTIIRKQVEKASL